MSDISEVQISYDLAREDSDLTAVTLTRVFENGFKVLLQLQGDDAVAFIDAWNARSGGIAQGSRERDEELAQQVRAVAVEECCEIVQAIDSGRGNEKEILKAIRALSAVSSTQSATTDRNLVESLCEDCPPFGYETDKTRCLVCPRRASQVTSTDRGSGK